MLPAIASLIEQVRKQEQRNRLTTAFIVSLSIISATLIFFIVQTWYPRWVSALAAMLEATTVLWVLRMGLKPLRVSSLDAAALIDGALGTKERALAITSLAERGAVESQIEQEVIAKQLEQLSPWQPRK